MAKTPVEPVKPIVPVEPIGPVEPTVEPSVAFDVPVNPLAKADPVIAAKVADAIEFVGKAGLNECVRKLVAANAKPGNDYADIGDKRFVSTDEGTTQVVLWDGKNATKTLYHCDSTTDAEGNKTNLIYVCREGNWRGKVIAAAAEVVEVPVKVDPLEARMIDEAMKAFEAHDE